MGLKNTLASKLAAASAELDAVAHVPDDTEHIPTGYALNQHVSDAKLHKPCTLSTIIRPSATTASASSPAAENTDRVKVKKTEEGAKEGTKCKDTRFER